MSISETSRMVTEIKIDCIVSDGDHMQVIDNGNDILFRVQEHDRTAEILVRRADVLLLARKLAALPPE